MIDLDKHPLLKYPLFGSLYFSQGIIYALATLIIPVYFVEKGIALPITTTIIGIAYLPWILKFLFGGIADYFIIYGRKRFIIFGGGLSAISFFSLTFIDPKIALIPFTILMLIGSSGIAFLDVSADAWAIQETKIHERGKVNAAMYGGLFIGMAFTTSAIANIADILSYQWAFIIIGIIISLIIIFPLIVKEKLITKKPQKIGKLLFIEFKKRPTQLITLFAPFSAITFGILAVIVPIYMKTVLDLSIGQIGIIVTIGPVATVIGNIAGGFMTDQWGRKKSLYVFLGLIIIFTILLIFADSWQRLAILWGILGFLNGGAYTARGAILMDVTNPKVGAAQYSIMTSMANCGEMGGTTISGSMIASIGFAQTFLYAGWIMGPTILILYFIRLATYKKNK